MNRDKEIEAFVIDILQQCSNKGFSMSEVDKLCCKLKDTFRKTRYTQVNELKYIYSSSNDSNLS